MILTNMNFLHIATGSLDSWHTLMCLSIGIPKNNKFSICSKWNQKFYFEISILRTSFDLVISRVDCLLVSIGASVVKLLFMLTI